ncbi:hypothetical protein C8E01_106245 [Pontibacter virosus]|uniref:Uncharacterized protein n=1 Tax=Pontibacter virosus TaxID=1765052 RepID=A0A2U1AWX5_9BACT|nr:hypothetical protein C8E01_106245 [Pontibacter virosus]
MKRLAAFIYAYLLFLNWLNIIEAISWHKRLLYSIR